MKIADEKHFTGFHKILSANTDQDEKEPFD